MKKLFFILIFFPAFFSVLSSCPHFEAGNVLYLQEDYEGALTEYRQCESHPSFSLFYNMGNAFYRMGRYGHARLYYEKARLLGPFARDLSYNTGLLKQYLTDEEDERLLSAVETNRDMNFGLLWLALVLFLFAFSRRHFRGRFLLYASLLLFIGAGVFVFMRIGNKPEMAVVLEKEVELHSGRNTSSAVLAKVHEGRLLSVVAEDGDWMLVEVKEGVRGWMAAESLGLVRVSTDRRSV
jgi:tetratricopeptide (TPR) repeat protein